MKKVTMLLLGLAMCVACSSSSNDDKNKAPGANGEKVNTTRYEVCNDGVSPSNPEGTWTQSFTQNGFQFTVWLEVFNNSVRITNDCIRDNRHLRASAQAHASYTGQTLSIYESAQDEDKINEPDFQMSCRVDIQSGSMAYSFDGKCLVVTDRRTNESMKMIPAY